MGPNRTSRTLSAAVLLLAASLLSCSDSGEGSDFPELEGWTRVGEVLTYDADTLWEYINGAAELFVEYDVQTCRTTDFSMGDLTVTVDLYDMGTPLNAYGVYERESYTEGSPFPGATSAVISPPYQALLLKGSIYAKVNAYEGELTEAAGRDLLEALAGSLSGTTELPPELGLLPEAGMVAGSEGYKRLAFMGLTELSDCVYAEYAHEGEEAWQGFAVLPAAAASVWDVLAAEWTAVEHGDGTVLYREVPYQGLVGAVRTAEGILGVSGAADEAELLARLDGFIGG